MNKSDNVLNIVPVTNKSNWFRGTFGYHYGNRSRMFSEAAIFSGVSYVHYLSHQGQYFDNEEGIEIIYEL